MPRALLLASFLIFSAPTYGDEAADRIAIETAAQAWIAAFNARDVARMLTIASHDIVLLDPSRAQDSPQPSARETLERALSHANDRRFRGTTKEITVVANIAWRIGVLTDQRPNAFKISTPTLEIWQRIDGEWQLHRYMSAALFNPTTVARPGVSEPRLDTPRH